MAAKNNIFDRLKVYKGRIVHCVEPYRIQVYDDGFVAVRGSKILQIGDSVTQLALTDYEAIDLQPTQILIPGLIDTHIHAPQYPNIGLGYDKELLDWLTDYTYPLEGKFKDNAYSEKIYHELVKKTLSYGTTTACYFASMYPESCKILTDCVYQHGQRSFIGKVNMTENCLDYYKETEEESIKGTEEVIKYVLAKHDDLIKPIITPRFVLSLKPGLMIKLGKMAQDMDIAIQTHISENKKEVEEVQRIFSKTYAEAYDSLGLLTPRTVLAHGVYLKDEELALIKKRGCGISHCPSSNIRLKSGRCDVRKLMDYGLKIGLGSDISGGDTVSIISAMKTAIDTSINISFDKENYKPIDYEEAFYLATLGGAKVLNIDDKVGNFTPGKDFDALIINLDASAAEYTTKNLLHKFVFTGDSSNITSVFIKGGLVLSQ